MPPTFSYPGVYIEEIPSGVRTIVGVPTSVTAFMGRTLRGPTDDPIVINSFGDFERLFGGLVVDLPMSYAVRDYYTNGGSQAIILRLYKAPNGVGNAGKATLDVATTIGGTLGLEAASPGTWGKNLEAEANTDGIDDKTADIFKNDGLVQADLFNLVVREKLLDGTVIRSERFVNLSLKEGPRRVDRVLEKESQLVRVRSKDGLPKPAAGAGGAGAGGAGAGGAGAGGAGAGAGGAATKAQGGSDSDPLGDADYEGDESKATGMQALRRADIFNLLCIPPDVRSGNTNPPVYQAAAALCQAKRAMLIIDPDAAWSADKQTPTQNPQAKVSALGIFGPQARNAALYFPRIRQSDPLRQGQVDTFVPCGVVAGVIARTDTERGVWKAPAGLDAALNGVQELTVNLSNEENGQLNPQGINCLRNFPAFGRVIWGARTLRGGDQFADEYKYIPVRRLALYIEESLYRGTQWAVFEPNDEPLWAQLRLNIGAFMQNLFRQGAFQGRSPREAYFVKCDKETTTQNDINLGIVNVVVGFAPLKPAEFVVIKIQQIAGQVEA